VLSLGVFVLLSLAHTWPLAAAPSHWARTDPGDGAFNIWVLNWVGHMLVHPSRLFDANIFYPERLTLAYSEAMIVQGALAMPLVAAGRSPVLVYNITLLAGMALTGWAFCLLVRRWTGSWSAGFVAGSLAAFNAFSLANLTHLQFQHVGFMAVLLFVLDRVLAANRKRDMTLLGVAFALQALTSIYTMVFAVWMLLFAALARITEWARRAPLVTLSRLAGAAAIAGVLLFPYLLQYWRVHDATGFVREAADAQAAGLTDFLATAARVHYEAWSKPYLQASTVAAFPGAIATGLLLFAVSRRENLSNPRLRMCLAAAIGCTLVAFAPTLPLYPLLHSTIALFQMVRALSNIAQVVLLMVAILAGFGVASLQGIWPHSRSWPLVAFILMMAVNAEATRAPMGYVWFDGVPAVYDVLAREPAAVVVELPFPLPQQWFLNTPYMVNSTRHWRPLLNGYSGFRPASYYEHYDLMRKFPSDEAILTLLGEGVTHVVVHQRDMNNGAPDDRYDPFEKVGALQLVTRDNDILIYRLRR